MDEDADGTVQSGLHARWATRKVGYTQTGLHANWATRKLGYTARWIARKDQRRGARKRNANGADIGVLNGRKQVGCTVSNSSQRIVGSSRMWATRSPLSELR